LDADLAAPARRVDELVAAERDPDVRRAARDGAEEDQIARMQIRTAHLASNSILLGDRPRNGEAVLFEHVLDQTAAVEAGRRRAPRSIRRADERQREVGDRGTRGVNHLARGRLGAASGDGEGTRPCAPARRACARRQRDGGHQGWEETRHLAIDYRPEPPAAPHARERGLTPNGAAGLRIGV
jgi:hypothetical protein